MPETISVDEELRLNPYKGKGFTVETKFMKQYRQASPVDHGKQGAAVRNKNGQIELFTIGTDGTIWNFYPDATSSTGYRKAAAGGLKGDFIAAGVDHGGSIIVLARSGDSVNYAVKYGDGNWSNIVKATLPLLPSSSAVHVRGIYARTVGGQLYVGVDGWVTRSAPPTEVYIAVSQWNVTAGSFQPCYPGDGWWPNINPGITSFWTHSAASATPVFSALVDPEGRNASFFFTANLSGKAIEQAGAPHLKLSNGRSATVDIESPPDSFGRNKIFFVAEDGILYQLTPDTKNGKSLRYKAEPLSNNLDLTRVFAVHGHAGGTHLFCLSKNQRLYHFAPVPQKDSPTGYEPLDPQQHLRENVAWVSVARNDGGNIELYYAKNQTGGALMHMTLDQNTGDWEGDRPVEVPESGDSASTIEEFISYSSDIAVTDMSGAPLANAAATISASDRTAITVNGATYSIDALTFAHIKTNSAAKLAITQQTTNLSVPDLWIQVEGVTPAGEGLFLAQYGNGRAGVGDDAALPKEMQSIETRLKGIQGPDLAAAKDASGKPLLKAAIRARPADCQALADAFQGCMKLRSEQPKTATATLHPLISREGAWTGLHIESQAAALERSRVIAHAGLPSWTLSFGESGVSYQALTPHRAQAMIAEMRANSRTASDAEGKSWWSTIGDFLESVVEGFFDAVVNIAQIVVNGVKVAVQFLIDGVKYVFDAAVEFVQQSFDLIETILATVYESVSNFFEKTFEWLGFLLNWDDILRTHKALAYTIEQGLGFTSLAAGDIKRLAHDGLRSLSTAVNDGFRELQQQAANASLGGYGEARRRSDPKFVFSDGNNFVMTGSIENAGVARVRGVSSSTLDTGPVDNFMTRLEQLATNAQGTQAFADTQSFMKTVGSNADNIFTALFSKLLEVAQQLVNAVIGGVQLLIDAAFEALAAIVGWIREFLVKEWDIPFVTALYSFITKGSPLTVLDLLSLVIAIPATTFYKIVKNKAPFPDDASVDTFKSLFNANTMLANFKKSLTGSAVMAEEALLGNAMAAWKAFLADCTGFAELLGWVVSAVMDIAPPTVAVPGEELLNKWELGLEVAAIAFSFPWFTEPFAKPNWKFDSPYDPNGTANVTWLWGLGAFLLIDCGGTWFGGMLPENWMGSNLKADLGVAISVVSALLLLIPGGIACLGASDLDRTLQILPVVPNVLKLGRLTGIVTATSGVSLAVVGLSDLLFGTLILPILTVVQGDSGEPAAMALAPAAS